MVLGRCFMGWRVLDCAVLCWCGRLYVVCSDNYLSDMVVFGSLLTGK